MADSELLECGEVEPRGLGVVEILFVFLAVVFCSLLLVGVPLLVFMWKRENVSRKRRKKRRDYDALLDRSMNQLTVGDGHKFERAPFNVGTQNSTVVFVMTDIENSTDHMGKDPNTYREVQEVHDIIIRDALDEYGGYEVNTEGDAFHCAFSRASQALLFCERVQLDLLTYPWSDDVLRLPGLAEITSLLQKRQDRDKERLVIWRGPRVRMGVHATHTRDPKGRGGGIQVSPTLQFSGPAFDLALEVSDAARGGQILLSGKTVELVREEASIFHMVLHQLGTFELEPKAAGAKDQDREGFCVSLCQAMPPRGPLSFRSFPALPSALLSCSSAKSGATQLCQPPEGDVMLVALRHSWGKLSPSAKHQIHNSLRSWIQQFGGYEVLTEYEGYVLVAFSDKCTAIKFAMAIQIGLESIAVSAPGEARPHYKVACALCSGHGPLSLRAATPVSTERSFSMSRASGADGVGQEKRRARAPPLGQSSSFRSLGFISRLASSIIMSRKLVRERSIGEQVSNDAAWRYTYPATHGTLSPSSFLGKKHLVLFFYFSNSTWGCTKEAKYFRDYYHLFQAHGAEVIGVSLDTVGSQEQFSSCLGLPFILLSDYPGGLHTIFSNSRLNQVQRRTYVVDKWGFLVDKYETALGIDGNGYPHVMHALESVQGIQADAGKEEEVVYGGEPQAMMVATAARPGTIVLCLNKENEEGEGEGTRAGSLEDLWSVLPCHGGPARPLVVDLGVLTNVDGPSPPKCALYGVLPSSLSHRWDTREGLERGHNLLVTKGAFDAPDPQGQVAIVFTFLHKVKVGKAGETPPEALSRQVRDRPLGEGAARDWTEVAWAPSNGYVSQEVGEGNLMVAFGDFEDALAWCGEAQVKVWERNQRVRKGERPGAHEEWVSMGVACGVPAYGKPHSRTGRQDYFGSVVNLAARVAKRAKPGQILAAMDGNVSFRRIDMVGLGDEGFDNEGFGMVCEERGWMSFKGFEDEVRVCEVLVVE